MNDRACITFLQWALPALKMRWKGFRKVRGQVCKRLKRRLNELQLTDLEQYKHYLTDHEPEWLVLDEMCRITISRFYRDWAVFDALAQKFIPGMAAIAVTENRSLSWWSAGCASGEEAYTLSLIWHLLHQESFSGVKLELVATDANAHMLERAKKACYPAGSLKGLPQGWIEQAFYQQEGHFCLHSQYSGGISWQMADIRREMPTGPFDLILCRNLVATYFEPSLQMELFRQMLLLLRPGGVLVLGCHENLPQGLQGFEVADEKLKIYKKDQFK